MTKGQDPHHTEPFAHDETDNLPADPQGLTVLLLIDR